MVEGQTSIFEMLYPTYKIKKPIRLISLFSGYDSQALSLKYLNIPFEHYKTCEWAVKSIQALKDLHFENDNTDYSKDLTTEEIKQYLFNKGISANYNEPMSKEQINRLNEDNARTIYNNIQATHNLVNIQQVKGEDLEIVDTNKYTYITTYSFPCQDLSVAGNRALMSDTSTRSGMLWEVERILSELKELPEVLLMENVIQVHGEGAKEDFNKWQLRLEQLGYKNYWQDLIATDYGIPQTRNRTFMVSILGDYNYTFPKPIPLKLKLKDMLEDNISDNYYLSDNMKKYVTEKNEKSNFKTFKPHYKGKENIAHTIQTSGGNRADDNFIIEFVNSFKQVDKVDDKYYLSDKMIEFFKHNEEKQIEKGNGFRFNVSDGNVIEKTITTLAGNRMDDNFIKIKNATKKGYLEATDGDGIDLAQPNSETRRGRVQKETIQTLTTQNNLGVVNNMKIRKLTPKECFRLMGVKDEDFEKIAKNQSDSSLYHLAGDSIVVNVLMAIFKEMID